MNKIKKAYRQNQLEGMAPERITLMLYEGALVSFTALGKRRCPVITRVGGSESAEPSPSSESFRRRSNLEQGGEIAQNLMNLYDYMTRELLKANLRGDADLLSHLANVLDEVRSGWAEMVEQVAQERAESVRDERNEEGRETGTYA